MLKSRTINIIFILILILISNAAYSQRMFVPSENNFMRVKSVTDWIENDVHKYSGNYCQGFRATDEYGVMCDDHVTIDIKDNNKAIITFFNSLEEGSFVSYDTLYNSYINSGLFNSDDSKGRFVELTYKNKYGKLKKTKGLFLINKDHPGFSLFYEKEA